MNRLSSGVFGLALGCALGVGVTGCGGDDDSTAKPATPAPDIEVKGTWQSDSAEYPETDTIDDTSWSTAFSGSDPTVSKIVEYSNTERTAVVLSPDDAKYNPATYSAIVWTAVADDSFYYCTASYGCASADQAKNGPADSSCMLSTPDDTDLDGMGCDGFPWTKLTAVTPN
ncbi:MAG TPA: hypothetical protein VMI54_06465 [Polyangiaceae bacterium]|nr:hypothetical protein [Polyangiaceae bacterium]